MRIFYVPVNMCVVCVFGFVTYVSLMHLLCVCIYSFVHVTRASMGVYVVCLCVCV